MISAYRDDPEGSARGSSSATASRFRNITISMTAQGAHELSSDPIKFSQTSIDFMRSHKISSALIRFPSDLLISRQISSDFLRSHQILSDSIIPRQISSDLVRSHQSSSDLIRSLPISSDLIRSLPISADHIGSHQI